MTTKPIAYSYYEWEKVFNELFSDLTFDVEETKSWYTYGYDDEQYYTMHRAEYFVTAVTNTKKQLAWGVEVAGPTITKVGCRSGRVLSNFIKKTFQESDYALSYVTNKEEIEEIIFKFLEREVNEAIKAYRKAEVD